MKPNPLIIFTIVLFVLFFSIPVYCQSIFTVAGDGDHADQGNGGPALCAATAYPAGICLDGKGNLYMTCTNSIRKVNLATGIISLVAGSDSYGHTGDGGPATDATLQFPYDVCMDKNDNLYISEYGGNYIRKINTQTGIISTVAGNGTKGFSGDGGLAVNAVINTPWGICTDPSGNIYFADAYNARIRKINITTGIITTIIGNGGGSYYGDGGLSVNAATPFPTDVASDAAGNIFFTESYSGISCRIRKINASTGIVTTIAGSAAYAYSGDGGPAVNANLFDPQGITIDNKGNVYVTEYDDSRIRKIDATTGIITTIAGTGTNSFSGDGGPAVNASLYSPEGLCADSNGDIYVADNQNQRVRKISVTITTPSFTPAQVNIATSTSPVCKGTPVTITSTVTNAEQILGYTWLVNGVITTANGPGFTTSALVNGDVVSLLLLTQVCDNVLPVISNPLTIVFGQGAALASVSVSASSDLICKGENVTFTANAKNAGTAPGYTWKLNGQATGTNSASFSSSNLADGDKINCILTPDVQSACVAATPVSSDTITIKLTTGVAPTVSVAASANDICPGTAITFTATVQNADPAASLEWQVNGISANVTGSVFTYKNFKDGDGVTCEIKGSTGCSATPVSSVPVLVQVKAIPVVTVSPKDTLVASGSQVQINSNTTATITSYQWQPATALVNAGLPNPLTLPMQANTIFTLAAIAENGCTVNDTSNIKIRRVLAMPNSFTPNNDGLNDVFRIPPNVNLSLNNFSVYDRWGNKIFSTTDIGTGWDGTYKGVKKETGVYVYTVSGHNNDGPVFLKGTVVLVR